jgi:hypothetical protein
MPACNARARRASDFFVVHRSNFRSGQAATDDRATTAANQSKAPQQAIQINRACPNKPNHVDRLGKPGVPQY